MDRVFAAEFGITLVCSRVKANAEWKVAQSLTNRGLGTFLPVQKRPSKQKKRGQVEIPLFPGYVFAQFDCRAALPVVTCPGVVHILCRGTVAEPVDPVEMYALQSVSRLAQSVEPLPTFTVGQKVRISSGPLSDVEGIVLRDDGRQRLIVSVSLLRRSVVAEIDREWLEDLKLPGEVARWVPIGV
ncbi:MAG: hypothetical protein LAO30_25695 [Acidobacteriia bacterium]|nr:hypothetical protein [Terriglobia bacterium]